MFCLETYLNSRWCPHYILILIEVICRFSQGFFKWLLPPTLPFLFQYIYFNVDVDIRVQELLQNFRVRFSTAIEADLVMEGVADQMVYQLLDLVKMQDRWQPRSIEGM